VGQGHASNKVKRGPVPKHEHQWYAISHNPETGQPVLWACGVNWRCIETRTATMKGRGKNRVATPPEPIIPTPYGGLWGNPPKGQS
jgi:hypothetical protein